MRAGISRLRGNIAFACDEPDAAYESLRDGADLIAPLDRRWPRACWPRWARSPGSSGRRPSARRGRRSAGRAPHPHGPDGGHGLAGGRSRPVPQGDTAAAAAALQRATDSARQSDDVTLLTKPQAPPCFSATMRARCRCSSGPPLRARTAGPSTCSHPARPAGRPSGVDRSALRPPRRPRRRDFVSHSTPARRTPPRTIAACWRGSPQFAGTRAGLPRRSGGGTRAGDRAPARSAGRHRVVGTGTSRSRNGKAHRGIRSSGCPLGCAGGRGSSGGQDLRRRRLRRGGDADRSTRTGSGGGNDTAGVGIPRPGAVGTGALRPLRRPARRRLRGALRPRSRAARRRAADPSTRRAPISFAANSCAGAATASEPAPTSAPRARSSKDSEPRRGPNVPASSCRPPARRPASASRPRSVS